MDNNLNKKIFESYDKIDKIYDDINSKLWYFTTKASELVELSKDDYQIEKSLMLNKISLKGYVLDSDVCSQLNDDKNYSIEELKNFIIDYGKLYNKDCLNYVLALSLYELIENIENLVNLKINLEFNELSNLILDIYDIKNANKNDYNNLYNNLKMQLDDYFKSQKINEKVYNICIQILNDIFNFYINGYPNISEEYLYKS